MSLVYFFILAFCLISVFIAFWVYKRIKKLKFFLTYALSVHALLLTSIAMILRILKLEIAVIDLLAGTTMFVSGYGLVSLLIISSMEKGNLRLPVLKTPIYSFNHLIMAVLGLWLIFTAYPTYFDVFLTIVILLFHASLIIPKGLEVPWILYKKSTISLKVRKRIISVFIIFLYILLPSLSLLSCL